MTCTTGRIVPQRDFLIEMHKWPQRPAQGKTNLLYSLWSDFTEAESRIQAQIQADGQNEIRQAIQTLIHTR